MKKFISMALLALFMFSGNVFAQGEIIEVKECGVKVEMPAPPPCHHKKEIRECEPEIEKAKKALITHFLIEHKNYFDEFDLAVLKSDLYSLSLEELHFFLRTDFVNPNVNLGVSLLTGGLGLDRLVIGQTSAGLLKLITCGGFGVWTVVDWFQIQHLTREYNFKQAEEVIDIIKR